MISIDEIVEVQLAIQWDADRNGVQFDAIKVYMAFYEQDRLLSGSNTKYLRTGEYEQKQDQRVDCCLNRLNSAYEVIKDYYLTNEVNE